MHTALIAAWLACQSLDLGTTLYGLHTGRVHEGNAVMRGGHLAAVKVSVNVGALWGQRRYLDRTGARWILPAAFATTGCLAGTWNLRTIARAQ